MANIIREALSLLNAMVHSGEKHTTQSATLYMSARHELTLMDTAIKQNAELRQQLEASQKLAEERRVALTKLAEERIWCYACGTPIRRNSLCGTIHEPDCDYIRLTKRDAEHISIPDNGEVYELDGNVDFTVTLIKEDEG